MKLPCRIQPLPNGRWRAEVWHSSFGSVAASAADRQSALEKLRSEIRYRLESSPRSAMEGESLELEVQHPGHDANKTHPLRSARRPDRSRER